MNLSAAAALLAIEIGEAVQAKITHLEVANDQISFD
jgi:hypothetical protein